MRNCEVGQVFGRLTVVEIFSASKVLVHCTCGSELYVQAGNLRHGATKSCGCLRREKPNRITHGKSGTLTHKRWASMRARCLKVNAVNYKNYGGRGITVCERWNDFTAFLADMGECPSLEHTLDRIDNDKGYEPGNCRWATRKEQGRNQRTNRILTYAGESLNVSAWAERLGIPAQTILNRLRYGWSIEKTLTTTGDARAFRAKPRKKP